MAPTNLGRTDDDELRKRGYTVGGLLGEGSYAKVGTHINIAHAPIDPLHTAYTAASQRSGL